MCNITRKKFKRKFNFRFNPLVEIFNFQYIRGKSK